VFLLAIGQQSSLTIQLTQPGCGKFFLLFFFFSSIHFLAFYLRALSNKNWLTCSSNADYSYAVVAQLVDWLTIARRCFIWLTDWLVASGFIRHHQLPACLPACPLSYSIFHFSTAASNWKAARKKNEQKNKHGKDGRNRDKGNWLIFGIPFCYLGSLFGSLFTTIVGQLCVACFKCLSKV